MVCERNEKWDKILLLERTRCTLSKKATDGLIIIAIYISCDLNAWTQIKTQSGFNTARKDGFTELCN